MREDVLAGIGSYRYFLFFLALCASRNSSVAQGDAYPHNAITCERCHSVPREFGSSSKTVQRVGRRSRDQFAPVAEGGVRHRLGESFENASANQQVTGNRVSLNLLGDGLVEAIADEVIASNVDRQIRAREGPLGSTVAAPILEMNGRSPMSRIGRFGWKSQHGSLLSSCADSLRNELGVRNPLYPDEYATHSASEGPTPFDAPDPRTGKTELDRLTEKIRHTSPPTRDVNLASSTAAQAGDTIFEEIGCAICHVPTYKTQASGTWINAGTYKIPRFLGNKVIHPYSDFLLHDVGTGDGIPQAAKPEFLDQSTANKFRTPPLWGLRFRARNLMHDGDTPSPEAAIKRHGGEATKIRDHFEHLPPDQKQQLLVFLSSL